MKSIILISAPAAGKGTVSATLKEEYQIPHISTGELLRAARNDGSERAKIIMECQDQGKLVPFEIVMEVLKLRLQQPDCDNGYILDGFPRNVDQAKAYDEILKELNKDLGIVIVLDIDKEVAKKRINGRVSCPTCGAVYNLENQEAKPLVDNICDKCNSKLTKRNDDNASVYDERYNSYVEQTTPLIDYYNMFGIVYHVDANDTVENVHNQINSIIGSANKDNSKKKILE